MTLFIIVAVVLIAFAAVVWLFDQRGPSTAKKSEYQYKVRDFIMSRAEHELFDILIASFGDRYRVFPQIHLDCLIDYKANGAGSYGARGHISQKSVDFVLCDTSYLRPLLAIELDDSSHQRENRISRDQEVERILRGAGLKLLRIQSTGALDSSRITQEVSRALSNG